MSYMKTEIHYPTNPQHYYNHDDWERRKFGKYTESH